MEGESNGLVHDNTFSSVYGLKAQAGCAPAASAAGPAEGAGYQGSGQRTLLGQALTAQHLATGPAAGAGGAPAASAARPAEGAASPLACGACSASAFTRSIRSSWARPSCCANAAAGSGVSLCCACTQGTASAAEALAHAARNKPRTETTS